MPSVFLLFPLVLPTAELPAAASSTPVILITVDDMSCDSIGVFGCPVEGTTPRIDAWSDRCRVFQHAHVQVGCCRS